MMTQSDLAREYETTQSTISRRLSAGKSLPPLDPAVPLAYTVRANLIDALQTTPAREWLDLLGRQIQLLMQLQPFLDHSERINQ